MYLFESKKVGTLGNDVVFVFLIIIHGISLFLVGHVLKLLDFINLSRSSSLTLSASCGGYNSV